MNVQTAITGGTVRSRTMRAAVLTGPGRIDVTRTPIPQPEAGDVRVRLEGCGVCASNLTPWKGPDWMEFPTAPGDLGHEGWGVVDAVGKDVKHISPGDRVAALSCRAYAEYDVCPASSVVSLPECLAGQPFPGEPLGCAMNILRRSAIEQGQTVAIIGIGFLGALLTSLASTAGARVIAISRRPFSLEMAQRMGATELIALDDHWRILEEVRELTGGTMCDRVIEVTGMQWPLDLAGELTRERGRFIIAGYHQDGPRSVNMQLWNWRGIDVVNAHERDPQIYIRGMRAAVEAVASGKLDPFPLITHNYPLEQLDEALNATRDRPEGFLKAWVRI